MMASPRVLHRRGTLFGKAAAAAVTTALILASQNHPSAQSAAATGTIDPVHAAIAGDVSALEALLASSSSSSTTNSSSTAFASLVRATDSNGWSALHEACRAGQTEAARFLIERGDADANARTNGGSGPTPLGIARVFHDEDHPLVRYLVRISAEDDDDDAAGAEEEGGRQQRQVVVGADGGVVFEEEATGSRRGEACEDKSRRCEDWAEAGICESNRSYMLKNCRKSCGVCKAETTETAETEIVETTATRAGNRTMIYPPPKKSSSSSRCMDSHDRCAEWADMGECDANPLYMRKNCKKSCGVCSVEAPDGARGCVDEHEKCRAWAEHGECDANPTYMLHACRKSCGVCLERKLYASCVDEHEKCDKWAEAGECVANPNYMLTHCAKSCFECAPEDLDMGEAQRLHLDDLVEETRTIIDGTEPYIRDVVFGDPSKFDVEVRKECKNRNVDCSYWAAQGECEANPKYMTLHCAPSCRTCEMIDFHHRCPIPENATDALGPGDLNAMFERIADDSAFTAELGINVTVLSRPSGEEEVDEDGNVTDDRPWVVTMENFVTPEECDRLIEMGGLRGYERSMDVGKKRFDGTYDGFENEFRTSENAWCSEECYDDPATQRVLGKIAAVTGVPETNSEHLQLLRYEVGQFYRTHHDFIEHHVGRPTGPRILTLYLYLNDVEEGGGTDFPDLGLTVMPKRGMALLWPSVLDEDPNAKDGRTDHQALPVERGVKFGANAWLHLRDYKGPDATGCV